MLSNPTVWLLDEPTTGLDPKGKYQVWRAIHTMLQNKDEGALLTTHRMEEAEAVCDQVAILVSGQLRISTPLVYKIPMEDALPLSKAFSMLEKAKQLFNLEEYSFSLNTLEQVFLELCKDQERDYFDLAPNTTFDWKKLQEGDL
ncbi:ATP-binding cassette sub-family A member 9-like [Ahaetulla prasina]|uniref:ATP-binding cassette sub-family A member 9-like n=1 Tax=Ahaetulla prasina TaxID=499056 RepID=UPI002648C60C|nr:ATP-binding cassette sub-family A member 9-like [Ahaetulla prasina]